MLNVRKLKRPQKRSGFKLAPGKKTTVRGLEIKNVSAVDVYVDRFTPWFQRKKKKTKAKVKK